MPAGSVRPKASALRPCNVSASDSHTTSIQRPIVLKDRPSSPPRPSPLTASATAALRTTIAKRAWGMGVKAALGRGLVAARREPARLSLEASMVVVCFGWDGVVQLRLVGAASAVGACLYVSTVDVKRVVCAKENA